MSLNSPFIHIHIITYKKKDIYIFLNSQTILKLLKFETRRFFLLFCFFKIPTLLKLFYKKKQYFKSLQHFVAINQLSIRSFVLQDVSSDPLAA